MAIGESPPFARGETYFNGGTADSTSGANYEGSIVEFADLDYSANSAVGAKPSRSNRVVRCMVVRNVAAAALLPKRLVTLKKTGLLFCGQVDGYADVTAEDRAFPVDEFLPTTGVPVNDLFYVVIEGPAMCMTDLAGAGNNLIAVGDKLVALTAASSGATTSGRVKPQDLTGATAVLGVEVANYVGRALSAKTTAQTNGDVLVEVGQW